MSSRANCNHRRHVATQCVLAICICSLGAAFASSVYVASQKVASAAIHRCDPSVRLWQLVRRITHSLSSFRRCVRSGAMRRARIGVRFAELDDLLWTRRMQHSHKIHIATSHRVRECSIAASFVRPWIGAHLSTNTLQPTLMAFNGSTMAYRRGEHTALGILWQATRQPPVS